MASNNKDNEAVGTSSHKTKDAPIAVLGILGRSSGVPSNLVIEIKKQASQGVKSPKWQARWILPATFLPPLRRGQLRHQHTRKSTGIEATAENIRDACKAAKLLYEEDLKAAIQNPEETTARKKVLLEKYWHIFIDDLQASIESRALRVKNPRKYVDDKKTLWSKKDGSGVGDQEFAKKDIRELDTRAGDRYQEMLKKKGFSASHIANHKTLLTKLVELAAKDYPQIPRVVYAILKDAPKANPREEYFFSRKDWEHFCSVVSKQSGDAAKSTITYEEYQDLPFGWKRDNTRNWVDFYDLCRLMQYCHLRTQDLSEIRGTDFVILNEGLDDELLEISIREPKTNVISRPINCMSHDAIRLWKRIQRRMKRKSDYVLFSHIPENDRRENKCQFDTLKTLLLQIALDRAGLPKANNYGNSADFTSMRHTGFMLELEDMRKNGVLTTEVELKQFAENGLTSKDMVVDVYLNHINRREFSANAVRLSKRSPNEMLLIKRANTK